MQASACHFTEVSHDFVEISSLGEGVKLWAFRNEAELLAGPDVCANGILHRVSIAKPAKLCRFLALGDSYTIGEAVTEAERGPVQLATLLCDAGVAMAEPEIIAATGWTTAELSAAIQEAAPEGPYDLVSLLIGVNNQYRGLAIDAYGAEFRSLLLQAVELAGGSAGRVLVLSIPDWGVTPFAEGRDRGKIACEIDAFNAVARAEAAAAGAGYIDVMPLSREAAHDRGLLAADGLHPSGAMYRSWAEAALPLALLALRE